SIDLLLEAFTTPASGILANYERLETLGDSFLKLQLSLHLFVSFPHRHEGFLAQSRIELENNKFLRAAAASRKIEGLILSKGFSRHSFVPPIRNAETKQVLSDKTVADVVESSIGAALLHGGPDSASNCVAFFLGPSYKAWDHYQKLWMQVAYPIKPIEPSVLHSCAVISMRIGYAFNNVSLLVEALTHPSAIAGGSSYERLEFLGDAILGLVATQFIYQLALPLNPGAITTLRSELVGNQFLAVVGSSVGLPLALNHMSESLGQAISDWTADFSHKSQQAQTMLQHSPNTIDSDTLLFWSRMPFAPKPMGDVVESVLGAVFVDSGFDAQAVRAVMDRIIFGPWWPRFEILMKNDGLDMKHPVVALADLVCELGCHQLIVETTTGLFAFKYILHTKEIGRACMETTRDAKKAAAFKAVEYITGHMALVKTTCDCSAGDRAESNPDH
ncbi:Dicer-like protein 1, partial [Kappamyces sp. JEL0680]